MRYLIAMGLTLSLTGVLAAEDWKAFESKEGKFKTTFPAEPKSQSVPLDTALGKVTYYAFVAETGGGNLAWGVSYNDYPDAIKQSDPNTVLQGAMQGAAGQFTGGKITKQGKIKIGNHPGLEFTVTGKAGELDINYHSRIYMVGVRLYQVQVVQVGKEPLPPEDITKFMKAFELTTPQRSGAGQDKGGGTP